MRWTLGCRFEDVINDVCTHHINRLLHPRRLLITLLAIGTHLRACPCKTFFYAGGVRSLLFVSSELLFVVLSRPSKIIFLDDYFSCIVQQFEKLTKLCVGVNDWASGALRACIPTECALDSRERPPDSAQPTYVSACADQPHPSLAPPPSAVVVLCVRVRQELWPAHAPLSEMRRDFVEGGAGCACVQRAGGCSGGGVLVWHSLASICSSNPPLHKVLWPHDVTAPCTGQDTLV